MGNHFYTDALWPHLVMAYPHTPIIGVFGEMLVRHIFSFFSIFTLPLTF